MNSDLSAHPDTDTGHTLLPPGALVPPGLRNRVSIQSPTLLSARLFFQRTGQPPALLTFLFFPPLKGNKSKGHLILLIPLTDIPSTGKR